MDILEAFEAAEIKYHKSESDEDEITICCPFCEEEGESRDTRFRLGINVSTGEMHCFNCGKGSRDADYTCAEIQRVLETGELEKSKTGAKRSKKRKKVKLPEDFQLVRPKGYWGKKAYRYVRSRGVTKRQIREKRIGYSVVDRHFHHRIVFTIYWKGKLQGLVGRDFTNKQSPPYKNSVGSKTLLNVPKKAQDTICLVEGVFDAYAVERAVWKDGIDSGATLGHTLTDRQLKMLKRYKRIILWYDPDDAGIDGLLHDRKQLIERYPKKKIMFVVPRTYYGKDDSDPSDLSRDNRVKRIRRAKLFTDSWVSRLKNWRAFDE